ncbi:MAG: DUF2066 domain-containing protein [Alphaproteobacteria bacterium]|nr:DUF2066 domain-containing protein [Alphaproteobacteria bacterium]
MLLRRLAGHRTVFGPAALCGLLAAAGLALSAKPAAAVTGDVYTVSRVAVDATGADEVSAKRAGVAGAKQEAFATLFERLTVARDAERLPLLSPDRLEFLIRDVSFESEKFGGGRYLAELTIRFQPDAVRALLRREGVAYAETEARPLVVVPVWRAPGGAAVLWSGPNPWLDAWMAAPPPEGLAPLIAPLGDLGDIAAIDAETALARDEEALAALAAQHGAGGAVVAVAEPAADGASLTVAIDVAAPGWSPVSIVAAFPPEPPASAPDVAADPAAAGTSAEAGALEEAADPMAGREEDPETALYRAAVDGVADLLEEAWTRDNLLRFDLGATVLILSAPLTGIDDLVAVRRGLEASAPVKRVALARTTIREAAFEVEYVGDIYQFQNALLQNGLTLALTEDASGWSLRRAGAQ